ncbi:MAG: outer membrane lipoprotein carrier protein LolA [Chthoniobacter sp.]|uniref:LolA family protein n=1 Tax=Chthoniobacter sp. TaxID=2510640 RepID=UPI0032A1E399
MRPVLALFFLLFTFSLRAADLAPAETQALLKNLQEHRAKFPSLSADFVEERTSHLLNKPLTSEGNMAFQVPNKFRREVTGKSPNITVSNGQKLWIYYPNFKEAELYTLGQKSFLDDSIAALTAGLNFQRVDQFYTVKATRETQGYRLALTPRSSGLKRMVKEVTVWVGDDLKIDRSETILAPKGDSIITTYKNQRPTPLSPGIFDFTPPADAHISQPLGK